MLDTLKSFLSEFGEGTKTTPQFEAGDYRLAAAALLVHVMTIDGQEKEQEHDKLRAILRKQFDLDDAQTDALIEAATAADREAIDLYRFTSLLNRSLDDAGRLRIVEMMWQIVYADGKVNEFEDNVIWRAADLLHVSSRDRIEVRRRISGQDA
ncbi:MAG TPA: TerB family tellurite resistance protein [Pseudorhodoplanes sp.]|nr:TerB family tellurite resistance protein [Pseudorhodoplanes sp.]